MISFSRFVLVNGLSVIVHEDPSTPMAAVNLLYNVGARDESPDKTGFAHLFEHLMFSGSTHAPDFDSQIQMAGGENNAYTTNDTTNFYSVVPAENLELILWLESDRMVNLNINEKSLDIQRKVVVEEFKESCLNQPYGDAWHHIAELAYQVHPYRWPTIGKVPQHIEEATLADVQYFYQTYYRPNNAVLAIAGNVKTEVVKELCEKWFGDLTAGTIPDRQLPKEPPQLKINKRFNHNNVPADALFLAFHAPGRHDDDYYGVDLLSDLLCNGGSSRLYRRLLKEQKIVSQIDAYISGSVDPGLLIIEARPAEGVSLEATEAAIWKQIEEIKKAGIEAAELTKLQNKAESTLIFSETNPLNKAINLAFFEMLGNASMINEEVNFYRRVTCADIQRLAQTILIEENCSEVYYRAKKES